ncbi:hypothetical protein GCM10012288_19640 [Malaciobacter pacificus]|uniref:Two-component system sensor histidine kinase, LytS/YehU family n=1 Tax=Malaciobacter pacificus TaxID=1080223 RepID=A0A5C2HB50_9BACT|nr:histidine kinase [Malaciobacter pacificus]QEP34426.1 two-component system sensor histidine kinase, LytS/YehU family [Malaciobacter pacificus]GGD45344.1 hypothetical protein GCM10012288_19640 [Malaciobacter pacificus]
MQSVELKVTIKDWLYIIIIGAFFGFFISLFFYFLNKDLQESSTIIFSISTAVTISLFASLLISLSNNMILPKVNQKFWYIVSFIFSFSSGFFGFLFSFAIFSYTDFVIVKYINNYWFYIAVTIGFLTFLVGLILHQFISMKYKNESIKTEILETKLKALENELNPHFLFNALNSVSELIYVDQEKAEKAVLHISKFLRNAINKDSLVSIETELSMVNTYVNIENIRFNNRIKLTTTVEENMKAVLIPKFSIQLLVENAIKHGYKTVDLNIDIKAYDEIIEVSNDGKISHNINYGTGLSNLDKRLDIQSIGRLTYDVKDDRMKFIIKLKKGK